MDPKLLNKKLISGFLTLSFRKIILLAISFLTINIILARVLPVDVIGVFNVANSILAIFAYFAEVGLGAALIQKKELHEDDLKTTFTIQLILIGTVSVILFLAAPLAANIKGLDESGIWLIRVLAIAFFLSAFKILPATLLERDLKFKELVTIELLETLIFNGVLIFLVYNSFGVVAFTIAALLRAVTGVAVTYIIAPWNIKFGISRPAAKLLLNFGVPFQLNSLLALFKDRLVALVVAFMIGTSGVSFNTWAQNIAFLPLEVMTAMIRLLFPAFSRLQDDQTSLKKVLEKSLFLTGLLLYPLLFGIVAIAPNFVRYIVTAKWQPALPLIYLFSITAFWATLSTTFTNFLNATGKIKITLKLMVMWTILEWILTPLLTYFYGFYGPAIASAIISFTSIITIVIAKKNINVEIIKSIYKPLICAVIMGLITAVVSYNFVFNSISLGIVILIGGLIYTGLIALFARKEVVLNVKGTL